MYPERKPYVSGIPRLLVGAWLTTTVLCTVLCTPAALAENLDLFEIQYGGKYKGLSVKMTSSLRYVDSTYEITQTSKAPFARIDESSKFHISDGVFSSDSYQYKRSVFGSKKSYEINFDEEKQTATYSGNDDDTRTISIPQGVADYLNYPLQIRQDLKRYGTDYPATDYAIVNRGRLVHYQFRFLREEVIQTPVGRLNTIVIEKADDDNRAVMWMATDWAYVPVRFFFEDGNHLLNLQRGTVNQIPMSGS